MSSELWIFLPLNPEPWTAPKMGIGRRGGKVYPHSIPDAQVKAYQEAIREELLAKKIEMLPKGQWYDLYFYWWRRLDEYELPSGRKSRRHQADATNMQKATEDALQGVLIDNDRHVRKVGSEIVSQGGITKSGIVLHIKEYVEFDSKTIPDFIWSEMESAEQLPTDNTWSGPSEEMF